MADKLTVKADKQVMSLFSITIWSNLVCIGLLVAINLINYFRSRNPAAAAEDARRLLSPDVLLLLSVVCTVWLLVRIVATRRVIRRMEKVFLTIEGDTVSGVSLPEPSSPPREYPNGQPFTLPIGALTEVSSREMKLTKKQIAPALILKTADASYVLPGIEQLYEIKAQLQRRMDASVS